MKILNRKLAKATAELIEKTLAEGPQIEHLYYDDGSCVFLQHAAGLGWNTKENPNMYKIKHLWNEWREVWDPQAIGAFWLDFSKTEYTDRAKIRIKMLRTYASGRHERVEKLREELVNKGIL